MKSGVLVQLKSGYQDIATMYSQAPQVSYWC